MKTLIFILIAAASIPGIASISCQKTTYSWPYSTFIYCSSGYKCCGTEYTRYCCYDYDYSYTSTYSYGIGTIIGGVIGGIVFIIVVITIIVCVCKSNNRSRGVVVQAPPHTEPNVSVINQNNYPSSNTTYPPAYPPVYPPPYPNPPGQVNND